MKLCKAKGLVAVALLSCLACKPSPVATGTLADSYFDNAGRDDVLSGGVKKIPVHTPKGEFHVWTKRIGNNPTPGPFSVFNRQRRRPGSAFVTQVLQVILSFQGDGLVYTH